jgi:hypothetical protein
MYSKLAPLLIAVVVLSIDTAVAGPHGPPITGPGLRLGLYKNGNGTAKGYGVPDGGSSALLLGTAMMGLAGFRALSRRKE